MEVAAGMGTVLPVAEGSGVKLDIWHCEQDDGTWVATCEPVPGWFCFGESLDETRARAEASLVHYVELADFRHRQVLRLEAA